MLQHCSPKALGMVAGVSVAVAEGGEPQQPHTVKLNIAHRPSGNPKRCHVHSAAASACVGWKLCLISRMAPKYSLSTN